ncbi:MFS transporter [Neptunicoccus sediminis]|uniref:MFS transporter n=1 Tax=Neptunicoccus sediminis TaxID=1892596 RepID=UPI0008461699|nr:MFS transporter [Neptunicoccus sediminis]
MTGAQKTVMTVILLWFAGLGAAAQFAKFSLIFADLSAHYADSGAGPLLGFLVSGISLLGIVFGLTAGVVVARFGVRRLLIAGMLLGAVASLVQAALPPLGWMLAVRMIEGLSHLVVVVAAPTLISQITLPRFQPLAMSLWSTFFGVAYALTAWLGTPLVAAFGLPSLFYVHALWMFAMAAALWAVLPQDQAGAPVTSLGLLRQHIEIYTDPARAAPGLAWLCYTLTFVAILTVIPPFLPDDSRAAVLGIMPLAGILVSMTLGVILQRWFSPVSVVVLGFACAGLATLGFALSAGAPLFAVLIFAALGFVQGANFSAIPDLNPTAEARAHAQGAVAQMGNLGNTLGTPVVLVMIGLLGFSGLILFALLAYGAGIAVHLGLARKRAARPV